MNALPTPPTAGRRRPKGRLLATAVAALLAAAPSLATVWSRANVQLKIPKGGSAAIEDASYSGRDWGIVLTALEVREEGRPEAGMVNVVWTFRYTNSDKEPHFATVNVRCLDSKRNERSRFSARLVFQADTRAEEKLEVRVKHEEAAWSASTIGRIVVDFLSGPNG